MSEGLAPVALFAYRRPEHVQRTLSSLADNPEACSTDLIAFIDGPATTHDRPAVEATRKVIEQAQGFRSVTIHAQVANRGLSESVVAGIDEVLQGHPSVIVLEDDLEVSPAFLAYMNDGLHRFADVDTVASIHGYVYPLRRPVPPAFFIRGADCWGWATWRRAWWAYRPDGQGLLQEICQRGLERAFDFDGSFPYTSMLRAQVEGRIDSWAIRWYASAFIAGMLTLYPGTTLVRNVGQDGTGTHGDPGSGDRRSLALLAPDLSGLEVVEDADGLAAFINYFHREQRLDRKAMWQVRRWRQALLARSSRTLAPVP